MQTRPAKVRYPILFSAEPPTTDRVKTAILSYEETTDVPVVGRRDVREAVAVRLRTGNRSRLAMIEFGGSLYRWVCKADKLSTSPAVLNAFESVTSRAQPTSPFEEGHPRARSVGNGVWNRMAHRLFIRAGGPTGEEYAWPPGPFTGSKTDGFERSDLHFENFVSRMGRFDESEYGAALVQIAAEAERLLWVEDQLWVKSPPLAYVVERLTKRPWSGSDQKSSHRVRIAYACLPEWIDHDVTRRYFPLSDREAAERHAQMLVATVSPTETVWPHDETAGSKVLSSDLSLFAFDADRHHLARTGALVGGDIARWLNARPELAETLASDLVEDARDMERDIGGIGWNHEEWPDFAPRAEAFLFGWRDMGFKPGWMARPSKKSDMLAAFFDPAMEMAASLPIDVQQTTRSYRPG